MNFHFFPPSVEFLFFFLNFLKWQITLVDYFQVLNQNTVWIAGINPSWFILYHLAILPIHVATLVGFQGWVKVGACFQCAIFTCRLVVSNFCQLIYYVGTFTSMQYSLPPFYPESWHCYLRCLLVGNVIRMFPALCLYYIANILFVLIFLYWQWTPWDPSLASLSLCYQMPHTVHV